MTVLKKMKKIFPYTGLVMLVLLSSCSNDKDYVIYHRFPKHAWYRYNILQFEIPVERSEKAYDVIFFTRHTKDYPFDNLDFNMIMTTPSGEERIKEYHFVIKRKDGGFTGECTKDSCMASIPLKNEIYFPAKGILKIEIETLVPRVEIPGILGVGIRLHRRG
jgi:gliding motility-associated lipoprotein GldH